MQNLLKYQSYQRKKGSLPFPSDLNLAEIIFNIRYHMWESHLPSTQHDQQVQRKPNSGWEQHCSGAVLQRLPQHQGHSHNPAHTSSQPPSCWVMKLAVGAGPSPEVPSKGWFPRHCSCHDTRSCSLLCAPAQSPLLNPRHLLGQELKEKDKCF